MKVNDAKFIDNIDWLGDIGFLEMLREVGPHFTINRMLTMDSVKNRLDREQPMTFLEFNYMILQSFDFLELHRRHGVMLQMGGSDQWGNITSGIDLTRRITGNTVFGLTSPLLTTASGNKMGKTAAGAVWLDRNKTSVFDFWQFWRNTEDADVGKFLRLFTDIDLETIEALETIKGAKINDVKITLANAVTTIVHGHDAAVEAHRAAIDTFDKRVISDSLPKVDVVVAENVESISVLWLFICVDFATSKTDARRLIRNNGARINDVVITDVEMQVSVADLKKGVKLSSGKKRHVMAHAKLVPVDSI
jgi:tyrosyl-tRNA synthetase